jgi:hypothetical protein
LFGIGLNGTECSAEFFGLTDPVQEFRLRFIFADSSRGELPRFALHVLAAAVEFGTEDRDNSLLSFDLAGALRQARGTGIEFSALSIESFGIRAYTFLFRGSKSDRLLELDSVALQLLQPDIDLPCAGSQIAFTLIERSGPALEPRHIIPEASSVALELVPGSLENGRAAVRFRAPGGQFSLP